MKRACASCGLHSCDGIECYLQSPAPPENTCLGCDKPWDANGYCAACEQTAEEQITSQVERELRRTMELLPPRKAA